MPNGTPDSDTFRRVFERLDPNELAQCLEECLNDTREDIKSIDLSGNPIPASFRQIFRHASSALPCITKYLLENLPKAGSRTDIIAIDGKIIRGSGNTDHSPYHVGSARAGSRGLTLGQVTVNEKSSEITAIPLLLDTLDVAGFVVTIDAMGMPERDRGENNQQKADYCLALKGNHKNLYKQAVAGL